VLNEPVATIAERRYPALVIDNLFKSFSGNTVLSQFDLEVAAGEIHALLGSNGSGKSTLIKVLSGFHAPDPGSTVRIDGNTLRSTDPEQAYQFGCRFVHQDLGLIASLSVLDNLFLTSGFPTVAGMIRRRTSLALAREVLDGLGLLLDPMAMVSTLSAAERTGVAIARALRPDATHPPKVLVLDEPTAALPVDEAERVLATVRAAAARGVAIVYVSHHLAEVYRIASHVTVLRDGRIVGRSAITDIDRNTLVTLVAGESIGELHSERRPPVAAGSSVLVTVERLSGPNLDDVSMTVASGEILGVAGLDGSGRESLLRGIFGCVIRTSGSVRINSTPIPVYRPDAAIRAGAAYLPADRKGSGGAMTMTAQANLTLADLRPLWRRVYLSPTAERREVKRWFENLRVRPSAGYRMQLGRFSGGNQQKILLSKWLRRTPSVLLLDDPTQGVDVAAKTELHKHILALAAQGSAVVVSSTDADELASLCNRIVVMRSGRVVDELYGHRLDSGEITRSILADATHTKGHSSD
jgi:ribose transport system ATP-binding protein